MRVNREDFLGELEAVLPGLSAKEIIEQSSCFVFKDGRVTTFNDEVACSQKSCVDIEGAVRAIPLVSILRKLQEDEIEVTLGEGELLVRGKQRRSGIKTEAEILLPVDSIKGPKSWRKLSSDFADAVSIVRECAGTDDSEFMMTCIHICPDWIEACDNHQAARYKIQTAVRGPTLVRKESLKYIISLDMCEFGETKTWIHFRNAKGLVLSCRRFIVDEEREASYPDLALVLDMKGSPTVLPKGLKEAAERAEVFSAENIESNRVLIQLQEGKLKITGRGASGWFSEIKQIKYKGKAMSFTVSPKLLAELVQQYDKCSISTNRLKVSVSKLQYITALGKAE